MKRRAQPPTPTPPACAECARFTNLARAAEAEGDHSRATDMRVLLHRHQNAGHPVAVQREGEL
ncbi:hypothetical protein ABZ368_19105 [Streptomyces sp. NPDC005908]|uniref:hypothetical protein n=1 Tax=Streptomyces sp. NPDC005908 TaxID=3157084 RepID=UPI00340DA00C